MPVHTGEERFHPSVVDSGVGGIHYFFMCVEITCTEDLLDSVEGDEDTLIVIDTVIAMTGQAATVPAPMLMSPTFLHEMQRRDHFCGKTYWLPTQNTTQRKLLLLILTHS